MTTDRDVIRLLEQSAVVGAVDRVGRRLLTAVEHSRLLPMLKLQLDSARARPGATLLAATAAHVILQWTVARPVLWYWLILPSIYGLAGVLLLAMVDSKATPRG